MSNEIAHALELLFEPSTVVELRAFKGRETISGYFDDREALAEEAAKLDARGFAVYVTLNRVKPALLARAANRARRVYREPTTSDSDIVRRRWLPLDFDPVRPADVSSTDEEKRAALLRAREVRDYLRGQGWPEPVVGDSGNGAHLLYRVDLPNDRESLELVKGVLEALSFKFSDEAVEVDTTTCNAARIWKLYGTTARKGDDTKERPHRRSGLLKTPESRRMEVVDREKLEAIAAMKPSPPPREGPRFRPDRNGYREFDLEAWIGEHGVSVKREGPWDRNGHRWVLEECPWNGHTDNAAYIVRFASGAIAAGCHHNSCQGYGWRDLREHYEPGAYERNGHQAEPDGAVPGVDEWEPPAPLPEGLPPVDTFDPAMLPESLKGWISDISERMQVPPDYCAAGAVVAAAALIGRKVGIHPKRHDDWLVVPNLWGAVVGKPAMLKSPALAEIMKPLDRLVAEARKAHEEAKADHEAEVAAHEAKKAVLKEEVKKAAKESAKTGDGSKLDEAIARQRDLEVPQEPKLRRYKTEDATVEKISELLMENPRGILVHRDELSGWLRSLDKHGREGDRSFYLESWNGTGSFDVDRIGRGSLHVPALCLSILGGIQPGPLSSYVYEAARGGRGDDGLLQRFQLLVWPDPPKTWRNVDRWPDSAAKNRAYAVYGALDTLVPEDFGATASEDEGVPAMRFSPEAQEVFDRWRDELEARLRSGDLPSALESHLAKYRSLMPSLALVFYLVASVDGKERAGEVSVEATCQAAAWCEYLETHAKRLYDSAESPAMEGARALLGRIRKGDVKDGSSIRDVYRKRHWSRLSTSEEVSAAAAVLEEYGWLRVEKAETGGRPATRIRLHPSLREAA